MAKATTIKDALKKLEETRGVNAAELEKVCCTVLLLQLLQWVGAACRHVEVACTLLNKPRVHASRLSCMASALL